jgi:hypothetical protein
MTSLGPIIRGRHWSCPRCGRPNDAVAGVDTLAQPVAGDWLICFGCRTVAVLDVDPNGCQGMQLRLLTPAEHDEAYQAPAVQAALRTLAIPGTFPVR